MTESALQSEREQLNPSSTDGKAIPEFASKWRRYVIFLACSFLQTAVFGMLEAMGVLYVEITNDLRCPRSQAALVQTVYRGLSFAGGLLTSIFVLKYDSGFCVMIASCMCFLGCACCTFASNITMVIMMMGVVTGLFSSTLYFTGPVVVNWTFRENAKPALSLLFCVSTIAQIAVPYVTNVLIASYSWRGCLLILGSFLFLNGIACGLLIHLSGNYFDKTAGDKSNKSSGWSWSIFKDVAMVLYLQMALLFGLFGPIDHYFVVDMAVLKGYLITAGALLLSVNGVFGFIGRILSSVLLNFDPNTRAEIVIAVSFCFGSISRYALVTSPYFWGMIIAIAFRGLSNSIIWAFMPALQIAVRGAKHFPQTLAITSFLVGVSTVLGGVLGGLCVDITGSYNLVFSAASLGLLYCIICMSILHCVLRRRNTRSTDDYELLDEKGNRCEENDVESK